MKWTLLHNFLLKNNLELVSSLLLHDPKYLTRIHIAEKKKIYKMVGLGETSASLFNSWRRDMVTTKRQIFSPTGKVS